MKYRIAWKSKITSQRGHGTMTYDLIEAERICKWAISEFPEVEHWPEAI